jgi:hypothetical protein
MRDEESPADVPGFFLRDDGVLVSVGEAFWKVFEE